MKRRDIVPRLAAGELFLLDGATGSELQRRGVNVSRGVTPDGELGAWSATAMEDAPEMVREIHEDHTIALMGESKQAIPIPLLATTPFFHNAIPAIFKSTSFIFVF